MKATLAQLLAAAQLAEMLYQADQVDHKREAWEKAKTEYEQAVELEQLPALSPSEFAKLGRPVKDLDTLLKDSAPYKELEKHAATLAEMVDHLDTKFQETDAKNQSLFNDKLALAEENAKLKEANLLLNSQLIEKSQKIDELEKSSLSAKPTVPATAETTAPAATPESAPAATETELTPYQKGLLTRAANLAAKAEGEPKKNS